MSKRQLLALFLCSLVPWTTGNGLLPLLPVYATEKLKADPAVAGYYLAFSYLALAFGTVAAGWLSDRLRHRKALLIVAGVASIPTTWLMGRTMDIWLLTALTATLWFLGGVGIALINILTGLFAGEGERGKMFGILSLTGGLGALIGGATTGPIADHWGYPAMFSAVAIFLVLWPLAGLLLRDKEAETRSEEAATGGKQPGLGKGFYFLLMANLAAAVAVFVSVMSRSLAMGTLRFDATAIASTGAVGGAATLPLLPLIGWLSDRVGRRQFLILCYVAGMACFLVLAVSVSLWHFWVAALLHAILSAVNGFVGSAWVTDLVPQESLGRGLSLFNAAGWFGGSIGFAITGYSIQNLGMVTTLAIGAFLVLAATVLVVPIRARERFESG